MLAAHRRKSMASYRIKVERIDDGPASEKYCSHKTSEIVDVIVPAEGFNLRELIATIYALDLPEGYPSRQAIAEVFRPQGAERMKDKEEA